MIFVKTDVPKELNDVHDELKAIYHSKNMVFFLLLKIGSIKTNL